MDDLDSEFEIRFILRVLQRKWSKIQKDSWDIYKHFLKFKDIFQICHPLMSFSFKFEFDIRRVKCYELRLFNHFQDAAFAQNWN